MTLCFLQRVRKLDADEPSNSKPNKLNTSYTLLNLPYYNDNLTRCRHAAPRGSWFLLRKLPMEKCRKTGVELKTRDSQSTGLLGAAAIPTELLPKQRAARIMSWNNGPIGPARRASEHMGLQGSGFLEHRVVPFRFWGELSDSVLGVKVSNNSLLVTRQGT